MPLPSLVKGAKQCQVLTKRTKQQCQNPAAYGCTSCRMHGAHKSRKTLKGENHPQFKHGKRTKEAQVLSSNASLRLIRLEEIGFHIKMFVETSPKTRGKRAKGWMPLDLNKPEQLAQALLESFGEKFSE